jgi:type I restriction enzyme, S subunit
MRSAWTYKNLGDLCDVLDSLRRPITKRNRKPGEYPYYGSTGIQDFVEGYLFDEPLVLVGEDGAKWASGENTAFPVQGKCWVNNHAHVLRPNRTVLLDQWLINFLVHSDLSPFVSGLTVPKLNQGSLREIIIPLPPIPEQQRIVTLLGEAFASIATARAAATQNLQNARALFESHLQSVLNQRGKRWVEKSLQEIGTTQTGSTPNTADQSNYGRVMPFVKPGDFLVDGSLNYNNSGLSEIGIAAARKVQPHSVLMVCIGATIGKTGYCDRVIATNQQVNAFTPNQTISYKYIYYYMLTEDFQRRVIYSSGQATLPIINKSKWSALSVWMPVTLNEQLEIVDALDSLREKTQRLESIYQRKIQALDELKQSLLHQAFSGQLTADVKTRKVA